MLEFRGILLSLDQELSHNTSDEKIIKNTEVSAGIIIIIIIIIIILVI